MNKQNIFNSILDSLMSERISYEIFKNYFTNYFRFNDDLKELLLEIDMFTISISFDNETDLSDDILSSFHKNVLFGVNNFTKTELVFVNPDMSFGCFIDFCKREGVPVDFVPFKRIEPLNN